MNCPACGADNRDQATYCHMCGAALSRASSITVQPSILPRDPSGDLQSGILLQNRYRISLRVAKGGFGVVYLAYDQRLNQNCALKESLDTSPESRRLFQREVSFLLRMNHPRLVRVYDFFDTPAGELFLVMDYIEGEDLGQILTDAVGTLPEDDVIQWALQVCDVLDHMHTWVDPDTGQRAPIIHRDVKPDNLKLQPGGSIKVIDLGLAKVALQGQKTTAAIRGHGTPPYCPFEQYAVGTDSTDERSDIYALGATLYHLATGHEPPEAPVMAHGRLTPPRQHRPNISPWLQDVILKAMRLQPDERFQTVQDMQAALSRRQRLVARTFDEIRALLLDALNHPKWVHIHYSNARGVKSIRGVLPSAVTPNYFIGDCDLTNQTR
ncbi:protein kinase, partial [Chloroflexota bacterium]